MATITRQPFAPLDGARLQNLTSLKNRQNAVSSAPVKRKASEVDTDDFENLDPVLFSKRSKGGENGFAKDLDFFKPSAFVLTKAASTPSLPQSISPVQAASTSSRPRSFLQPRSPAAKLNTNIASPSLTAPAGRSPTRGSKRIGILSKRRTARIAPPAFGLGSGSAAPFSLDAALKGTISNYGGRSASSSISSALSSGSADVQTSDMKSSWFFDIHEDTPEQEMTNLLQHSTCTLDISSDEESEQRASRERAEGRDKENIPPADDVSQTSRALRNAVGEVDMMVEKARGPLVEMNAADYYAKGCDGDSVVIVPEDDDLEADQQEEQPVPQQGPLLEGVDMSSFEFAPDLKMESEEISVDAIMGKEELGEQAAVLAPIEGTGESFELWESSSVKDEADAPASPAPIVDASASE